MSLPPPFPLANAGATCHFNALLQALASCPAFTEAAAAAPAATASPLAAALAAFARPCLAGASPPPTQAAEVLGCLVGELRRRGRHASYGPAMQSATEGLVLMLELLEPVGEPLRLRTRVVVWCRACGAAAPEQSDTAFLCHYFHHEEAPPSSPEEFARGLLLRAEKVEYYCEACGSRAGGRRVADVRRLPPVLGVVFNQYAGLRQHYFPPRFEVPARGGGVLTYSLVAQIENNGGHYWTQALRRGPGGQLTEAVLNDMHTGPGRLGPTPCVYTVFYHIEQ